MRRKWLLVRVEFRFDHLELRRQKDHEFPQRWAILHGRPQQRRRLFRPGENPHLRINGTSVTGDRKDDLGGKFELTAEGTFAQDLYVTVAKSEGEGHISAKAYGPVDKAKVNETLTRISSGEVPNKVFVAFSTTKASWPKGLDEEMDQEIEAAWGLLG